MIIYGKEKEIIKAQKRSIAAWINNTLGSTVVDADNLMTKLSTGVILCKLARCIQEKVDLATNTNVQRSFKFWESARRESFFARDNAELFIRWCSDFGVREAVLFESDGLVLQAQPRTVLLCLLELSRLASRFGVLLPPPLQLPAVALGEDGAVLASEDEEEPSEDEFFFAATLPSSPRLQRWDSGCSSGSPSPSSPGSSLKRSTLLQKKVTPSHKKEKNVVVLVGSDSDFLDSSKMACPSPRSQSPAARRTDTLAKTDTICSRIRSGLSRSISSLQSPDKETKKKRTGSLTALDKRVLEVARQYRQDENKIFRISDGHYNFGGKNAFLRMVRGNNVVVRLGGGWDTLEHFLSVMNPQKLSSKKNCKKIANMKQKYTLRNISPYMTL
ncbi:growth arrest-specific protein 2-like [Uloborus diversus]|uniref:growth arrest-specific protein 2-like n=1 Tax=Uloborus diversus TaxID=327109 RepID=UPI00240A3B76|nr:growth arrest-specific protein 2-like [Uloborus diversus]